MIPMTNINLPEFGDRKIDKNISGSDDKNLPGPILFILAPILIIALIYYAFFKKQPLEALQDNCLEVIESTNTEKLDDLLLIKQPMVNYRTEIRIDCFLKNSPPDHCNNFSSQYQTDLKRYSNETFLYKNFLVGTELNPVNNQTNIVADQFNLSKENKQFSGSNYLTDTINGQTSQELDPNSASVKSGKNVTFKTEEYPNNQIAGQISLSGNERSVNNQKLEESIGISNNVYNLGTSTRANSILNGFTDNEKIRNCNDVYSLETSNGPISILNSSESTEKYPKSILVTHSLNKDTNIQDSVKSVDLPEANHTPNTDSQIKSESTSKSILSSVQNDLPKSSAAAEIEQCSSLDFKHSNQVDFEHKEIPKLLPNSEIGQDSNVNPESLSLTEIEHKGNSLSSMITEIKQSSNVHSEHCNSTDIEHKDTSKSSKQPFVSSCQQVNLNDKETLQKLKSLCINNSSESNQNSSKNSGIERNTNRLFKPKVKQFQRSSTFHNSPEFELTSSLNPKQRATSGVQIKSIPKSSTFDKFSEIEQSSSSDQKVDLNKALSSNTQDKTNSGTSKLNTEHSQDSGIFSSSSSKFPKNPIMYHHNCSDPNCKCGVRVKIAEANKMLLDQLKQKDLEERMKTFNERRSKYLQSREAQELDFKRKTLRKLKAKNLHPSNFLSSHNSFEY